MNNVQVKISAKLAKRGAGFVDPQSGIAISVAKTSGPEGQLVPRTAFIEARLHSGELIEVKAATPAATNPPAEMEVTFRKKVEIEGKEFKAGDKAKVNAALAQTLRDEGKIA